jgi:hypothetical protein
MLETSYGHLEKSRATPNPVKVYSMKNRKSSESPLEFLSHYGKLQPSKKFQYVTIHPLADEDEILHRLSLAPEKCVACDLYWAIEDRLVFVSIQANSTVEPFVNYWFKAKDTQVPHRFVVGTRTQPLKRMTIENALVYLSEWIQANVRDLKNFAPARITDKDLGSN